MIWDGKSPLQMGHEVACAGWPTEPMRILCVDAPGARPVIVLYYSRVTFHSVLGRFDGPKGVTGFHLVPLEKDGGK